MERGCLPPAHCHLLRVSGQPQGRRCADRYGDTWVAPWFGPNVLTHSGPGRDAGLPIPATRSHTSCHRGCGIPPGGFGSGCLSVRILEPSAGFHGEAGPREEFEQWPGGACG